MNFKYPISTIRKQSKMLLALGVKPETADMFYNLHFASASPEINNYGANLYKDKKFIPSWSLVRLMEMMPTAIDNDYCSATLQITPPVIQYWSFDKEESCVIFNRTNIFHNAIACIKWLIRNNYFNKEYLNNNDGTRID